MIRLVTEVGGLCPLCGIALLYEKIELFSSQQIAHIYPLNPTLWEQNLLANEARLSPDVNHNDNLIPLCPTCHTKFDKPRTTEEYRKLYDIKKTVIEHRKWSEMQSTFPVGAELKVVIERLLGGDLDDPAVAFDLAYHSKTVDEKLGDSVNRFEKRRIEHEVSENFATVRELFRQLEKTHAFSATQIALQVKSHYVSLAKNGASKEEILSRLSSWIVLRTACKPVIANIIVSFFVQNCEIF